MRRSDEVELARQSLSGRDLVVFSNDWDGDPLSKTHIMRILARDNRILWVNSIGNRAPRVNAHDAQRILFKLDAFRRGLKEVEPNIFVLAPLAIPLFGSKVALTANRILLRRQIRRAMAELGMRRPISWSYLPASAGVQGGLGEDLVVYQCVDEFSAFSDTNGSHIAALERELLGKADLVITSAERLRANKIQHNANTVLVRHGVDHRHFVRACDPSTTVPADIALLPHPIVGFYGLLADWVDLEALAAIARSHPEGSVVVIGKIAPGVNIAALRALPNVHFLGRRPYAELPGYCRAFDVAVLPFAHSELTLNSNPLKVREYLAAGLPCVASDLPEVREIGLCKLATTPHEFVAKVNEALAEGGGPSVERANRIMHESWEARVNEIRSHVARTMLSRS